MYEEIVVTDKKPKGRLSFWMVLAPCLAFLIIMTGVTVGGYMYYTGFRDFVGDFSKATSLTYRKGSIEATTAEGQFEISGENIYAIYNRIVVAGRGKPGTVPNREPDALLKYKFGGTLELWKVKMTEKSARREYGLFIRFTSDDGKVYTYDTDRVDLESLPLKAWQNKPK